MIKLLLALITVVIISGTAFYFAPDSVKEKGLAYIEANGDIPASIKEAISSVYSTPAMQRERLLAELDKNFASIENFVENPSSDPKISEPIKKIIERNQEIIKEVSKIETNPTLIKQVTEAVTAKLLATDKICPTPSSK